MGGRVKTSWKPGQSGNPTGRPTEHRHAVELLRQGTPEAVAELMRLALKDKDHRVRLGALTVWLRKVVPDLASVEMSGPDGGPVPVAVSADETLQRLARIVAEAKAKASGPKSD